MSVITFLDLAPQLQMKTPDAPVPYIIRCLREAVIEFCEKSQSYIYRFDPMVSIRDIPEYEVEIPVGTRIVKVWRIGFAGTSLAATSEILLDQESAGWESIIGVPKKYFFRHNVVTLVPRPSTTTPQAITGAVALKPTRAATSVDEDFFEENEQAIYDGALKIMFQDKEQLWGDLQLAGMHHQLFEDAIEKAKSKAQQDHTPKRTVMQYSGI